VAIIARKIQPNLAINQKFKKKKINHLLYDFDYTTKTKYTNLSIFTLFFSRFWQLKTSKTISFLNFEPPPSSYTGTFDFMSEMLIWTQRPWYFSCRGGSCTSGFSWGRTIWGCSPTSGEPMSKNQCCPVLSFWTENKY
jgi:hypothetical protein